MAFEDNAPDVRPEKKTGFTFRGRQIVLSKSRGAPFTGLVKKGMERGIYPEEKRIEAVTIYAATGHFGKTAELTKVPEHLIRQWRKQDWFKELLNEVRAENNEKLDAKFTEIVEKSLEQLVDRVENGDYHVLRDGSTVRKPIAAKDLSLVAAINVDKRQLLRGEPTSRSESVDKVVGPVERLENLAKTFEDLAKHGRKPETLDVTDAQLIQSDGPDGGGAPEASPEGHSKEQIP